MSIPAACRCRVSPMILSLILGWVLCLLADPVPAQDRGDGSRRPASIFAEAEEVRVIDVDVVVSGRDGEPVRGLSAADFELYENAEPVEFHNFYAVQQGRPVPLEGTVGAASAVPAERAAERPLYLVIFIDQVHLEKVHRDRALAHLRQVLDGDQDREPWMMVATNDRGVTIRQGFTRDPAEIAAALDRVEASQVSHFGLDQEMEALVRELEAINPEAGNLAIGHVKFGSRGIAGSSSPDIRNGNGDTQEDPGGGSGLERQEIARTEGFLAEALVPRMLAYAQRRHDQVGGTLRVLESFVDHVAGVPGRKAVLYVSGGLSLNPAEALFEAYERRVQGISGVGQRGASLGREIERFDLTHDLQALVDRANASGVTFYALDASPPGLLDRGSAATTGGSLGLNARFAGQLDTIEERNEHESMELIAEETGGRTSLSAADLDRMLETFLADFADFYSLGYRVDDRPAAVVRELEVRLTREARQRLGKGVKVRHRKEVREKSGAEEMAEKTLSALVLSTYDNPLGVELSAEEQTLVEEGKYGVPVTVQVPLGKLVLLPGERAHQAKVTIYVAVLDEAGRTSPVARQACPVRVPNEELLVALGRHAGCGVRLLMRPGRQRIAVGVEDEISTIASTVALDVTVGEDPAAGPEAR